MNPKRIKAIVLCPSDEEARMLHGSHRIWAFIMGNRENISSAEQEIIRESCTGENLFAYNTPDWITRLSVSALQSVIRIVYQTEAHHIMNKRPERFKGCTELVDTTRGVLQKEKLVHSLTTFLEMNKVALDRATTLDKQKTLTNRTQRFSELIRSTCGLERTLLIIDVSFLTFTSYYAAGRNSSAEERFAIFVRMFQSILRNLTPKNVALCFDSPVCLLKQEKYPGYKSNRIIALESSHFDRVDEFVKTCRIPSFRAPGFEADDVINSLKNRWLALSPLNQAIILTKDKDFFQICSSRVWICKYQDRAYKLYRPKEVEDEWGVRPDQFVDFQCLTGDSSDSVMGIEGVGKKTAVALLKQHESLKRIFQQAAIECRQDLLAQQKRILEDVKPLLSFLEPDIGTVTKTQFSFSYDEFSKLLDKFVAALDYRVQTEFNRRNARFESDDPFA